MMAISGFDDVTIPKMNVPDFSVEGLTLDSSTPGEMHCLRVSQTPQPLACGDGHKINCSGISS